MRIYLIAAIIFSGLYAPEAAEAKVNPRDVTCNFWLLEHPFNTSLKAAPSMRQSLDLTACAYEAGHKGIATLVGRDQMSYENKFWVRLVIGGFDFTFMNMPFGMAWLHEEWHRAVMSSRDISSYNEVYNLRIFDDVIKVSHVSDDDLIRLKKENNPDLVRLAEAGVESSYELNLRLQKDEFYRETAVYNQIAYAINLLNGISYIGSGSTSDSDNIKEEFNEKEDDTKDRDFVGHDFTSWVYDLHRPDEAYESRGEHPSGNGIDRYRGWKDLSEKERSFMKLQGQLAYLNIVDPFLLGFSQFKSELGGETYFWNANLRHHLTSFGYSIQTNFFLKGSSEDSNNFFFSLKGFRNDRKWFPGLEVDLIDYALSSDNMLTVRLLAWQQPREQSFYSGQSSAGGLLGIDYARTLGETFDFLAGIEGKTAGWVAGNPYLNKNLTLRTGLAARL
ncbi:MAG: hypothetical protein AB7T49_18195 [Oligoflexales bacterium]